MADDLDVLTLDEGKTAVALSAARAGDDQVIAGLEQAITAVSFLLDDLCGPVVLRTVTDELIDAPCGDLYTKKSPLYAVTTLKEYVSGTGTTLGVETVSAVGDYRIVGAVGAHDRRIQRRSGWNAYSWAGQVQITYTAGRYETTETVDAKFKRAAAEILQGNWSKYAAAWSRGGDPIADPLFFDEVTHVVNRWLSRERLAPGIA